MNISNNGMQFICRWEGVRYEAYQDTGGVWTLGYGHTRGVRSGQRCSEEDAQAFLRSDLQSVETALAQKVTVPISQGQYDALASFVFNIGTSAFSQSTLLNKLQQRDYAGAAGEFPRWCHDNGRVINGLLARREAEQAMFLQDNPLG